MSALSHVQLGNDILKPQWSNGSPFTPQHVFQIDCSQYAMPELGCAYSQQLQTKIRDTFQRVGLVHLINTGLTDLGAQRELALHALGQPSNYQGGSNPRNTKMKNVYEIGAPLSAQLHYHHEMAYIGHSASALGFLCQAAPSDYGYTYVSDNVAATDAILATELGQKLKRLGVCYHRDLTDREFFKGKEAIGVYNHWQQSMGTESAKEAELIARSHGLQTSWGPNRLLRTRYYTDAFEYCPYTGRNLLFASVADDGIWFDEWPLVSQLPLDERPLKLTFGDDSEMTFDEKRLFIDIYDRFGTPVKWRRGDVAVVCNYRFAHGRPGISLQTSDRRELGVIIGDSFTRQGQLSKGW